MRLLLPIVLTVVLLLGSLVTFAIVDPVRGTPVLAGAGGLITITIVTLQRERLRRPRVRQRSGSGSR